MSMPEEVNRLVTDQLSSMLLTPVVSAEDNLLREAVAPERIQFVGNIMAESVLRNLDRIRARETAARFGVSPGSFVLVTCHRPENTDHPERLRGIVEGLGSLNLPVLLPAHPRTRPLLRSAGLSAHAGDVRVVDPVGYLDMLSLQASAALVVTDSGGIQEEACMLHTPCVTVRRNTERQITLELGSNRLVEPPGQALVTAVAAARAGGRAWAGPERWEEHVAERGAGALLGEILPLAC
jgi:UDP-N-acetylglucosamine 2-epimerase (non-hydrolysing)